MSSLSTQLVYGQDWQNGQRSYFKRYTNIDGLSQGTIQDVLQDEQGYIWIGTQGGLNRFDGDKFTVYRYEKDNPNSLSDNFIRGIYQDSKQILWIGTDNGLNQLNTKTQQIKRFDFAKITSSGTVVDITEDNQGTIWAATSSGIYTKSLQDNHFNDMPFELDGLPASANNIRKLFKDKQGNIWVATSWGLRRYDHKDGKLTVFTHSPNKPSISHNRINAITEDHNGIIWIGTRNGLNRYETESDTWQYYFDHGNQVQTTNTQALADNNILSLNFSGEHLWIGTNSGLNSLNITTGKISTYLHKVYDLNSLSNNKIISLTSDKEDNLWVGTRIGLNKFIPKTLAFNHYMKEPNNDSSISHEEVSRFLKDSQGRLWVGTWSGGLNLYDHKTKRFKHFKRHKNHPNAIAGNVIAALYEDSRQRIWIGTFDAGISIYDPQNQQFTHLNPQNSGLSDKRVTGIVEQARGVYWISTFSGGLNRYDSNTNTFKHFTPQAGDENSIGSHKIVTLLKDSKGLLWIGTWDAGLNLYDPVKRQFKRFSRDDNNPSSISHNTVNSLYLDDNQQLWIGTNMGLNRYVPETQEFLHYDTRNGLQNDVVLGVTGDQLGNLWITTNYGLTRFDYQQQQFSHYNIEDGIQGLEFKQNGAYRSDDGEIFLGGVNGFNRFLPHQVYKNNRPISLKITELSLDNNQVPVSQTANTSDKLTIPKSINHLTELNLNYQHENVALKFAPQTSFNTAFLRYRYRVEGLNKQWIYTDDSNRLISLSNIPAGRYQLQINSTNHYGKWQQQVTTLDISKTSAPWFSAVAISLYIFIFLYFLYRLFKRQKIKRIRLLAEQQQKIEDHQKLNDQLRKLDKLKDEFLANTSHELRTPLNGIIGLTESLLDGAAGQLPDKANKNLSMVVQSGRRLNNLVNDILDFSKLRNKYMRLNCTPVDLNALVDVVLTMSQPLVAQRPIKLVNRIKDDLPAVFADESRLQQILYNLTGNAIKFTKQGKVSVTADLTADGKIQVSVIDTGIGIAKDQQQHIFSSFHQIDEHTSRTYGGTGLGLTICKQLVELHQGQLSVESDINQGSTFTFTLPVSDEKAHALSAQTINQVVSPSQSEHLDIDSSAQQSLTLKPQQYSQDSKFRILLVDDEPVNIEVLKNHLLQKDYQLVAATSGPQALEIIENNPPFDVVLLDIMMPQMSGYQVCKAIRQHFDMDELAIIFLTAKNQIKDLVQCFNAGGNDFVSKPVSKPELLARIQTHLRLIDSHRNLENIVHKRTQQLLQSEKLASLGTLTDGIAHEINNPTNFIHVGVQNLDIDIQKLRQQIFELADDEEDQEALDHIRNYFQPLFVHLNTIKKGSGRIKNIVEALQTFTQHGLQNISQVHINQHLDATLKLTKTKYKNKIEFLTNYVDDPRVYCNAASINQAFMHLVHNSCESIIKKQQKPIEDPQPSNTLAGKLGRVSISCRQEQQHVLITISDNGCGMDSDTLKRIADPFFTTKDVGAGTGLGLSMVYGIIRQHKGQIEFDSQLNQGTSCVIKLPISGVVNNN